MEVFDKGDRVTVTAQDETYGYAGRSGTILGYDDPKRDGRTVYNVSFGDNDHVLLYGYKLSKGATMDNLQVGDILVDDGGSKYKVLAVVGEVIALSRYNNFDKFSYWYTVTDLKGRSLKPYSEEKEDEVTELTLEAIADKFDIDVDKLRIKD